MKKIFSLFFAFCAIGIVMAQQYTELKGITGDELLGLKSGADPTKATLTTHGYSREGKRPVVFIIGDSTVKNGRGDGSNKQWGWGNFFSQYIDSTKYSVENHALGGRSTRTFITEGLWAKVLNALQPGDFVLVQFGHNDAGPLNTGRARASMSGNSDKDTVVIMEATGKKEHVYTYGHYLRQYVADAKTKGAQVVLMSHIPRNNFVTLDSLQVRRNDTGFGIWTYQAAKQSGAFYIDLNKLVADKYDAMGKDAIQPLFYGDHTHTSYEGALLNAITVAEGIKELKKCKLSKAIILPKSSLKR